VQPSYVFTANNQINQSGPPAVTYDAAGNMTDDGLGLGNAYTYDAENRIITAANGYTASYVYDAFGHRVRSTVNGQTRDFLLDLQGRTIDQYTSGTVTRSEAYAGGQHVATYANSTAQFDNSNWLGTSRVRTNASGGAIESCTSLPFGEDLTCSASEPSPIQFTGQEHDAESGNDHFPFRYYGETMARWLTPDPSGLAAVDPANPQSWNRYAYVNGNPLSFIDPTGLACYGPTRALGYCNSAAGLSGIGAFGSNWDEFYVAFGWGCGEAQCIIRNGLDFVLAPCSNYVMANCGGANNGAANSQKGLFKCASEFASKYSIAGGLQALGIGTSGVGGFITNALGGNAFSGATDLIQSLGSGEAGGHSVFYNMGQGVAAGPSQGFGAAFGNGVEGTPWGSGPVDVATTAILSNAQNLVTGTGQTIQTLNGAAELGTVLGETAEWASGIGEAKLGIDAGIYALGLAKCAAGGN
jgi:RHS repeat-associated protein